MMIIFSRNLQIFCLIATLVVLSACSQPSPASVPNEPKETPLITDADIDRAKLQIATSSTNIVGIEGGEASPGELLAPLADSQGDLSTQAVLPNTSGFVYYLRREGNASSGYIYTILRHDQQSDVITPLYIGDKQIQSVAGSRDGSVVVVSMLKKLKDNTSHYDIYLFLVSNPASPTVLQLTNDSVDNINVSMSNDIRRIVYQESVAGVTSVILRKINGFISYDRTVLSNTQPQRQPSISGDGRHIALVRDLANGNDAVLSYDIALNRYTAVATSPALLQHPSLSNNGLKVLWLESGGTNNQVFIKNLITATVQGVASGSSLSHPHLTADGNFIVYKSGLSIITKDLRTAQVQTIASDFSTSISVYEPTWQKAFSTPKLSGAVAQSSFGNSVSVSGNLMVVGAFLENNQTGAAYLYQRNSSGLWVLVKKLIASDGAANDFFGSSVSISGNTVVVGADGEEHDTDGNGTIEEDVGAAYIFSKDQGGINNWGQVKKLIANGDAEFDHFGIYVSISGNTVVVGAFLEDHDTDGNGTQESGVGAAYIFSKDQGGTNNWGQVKKLIASDDAADDLFGWSVSISGNTVVVGAAYESHDTDGNGTDESFVGAAYIFSKDQGGTNTWGQVKKLLASDDAEFDIFGWSVSISGNTVVVGAAYEPHDTDGDGTIEEEVGAAYIFQKDQGGTNTWGQVKKLTASDDAAFDTFGWSVSISGNTVVVGAYAEVHDTNGNGTDELAVGAAYLFQKDQGNIDNWGQVSKLTAFDGAAFDSFGASVSISGSTVVVGALGDAVYIYE
jgi:FG-GAP repeat